MVNNPFSAFSNPFASNPFFHMAKDQQGIFGELQEITNNVVEKFIRNTIQASAQFVATTVQNSQKFDLKNPEEFFKNAVSCSADLLQTTTDYMSANWQAMSNALVDCQNFFSNNVAKKSKVKTCCNEEQ